MASRDQIDVQIDSAIADKLNSHIRVALYEIIDPIAKQHNVRVEWQVTCDVVWDCKMRSKCLRSGKRY